MGSRLTKIAADPLPPFFHPYMIPVHPGMLPPSYAASIIRLSPTDFYGDYRQKKTALRPNNGA